MFELTNVQRKCFGLRPVERHWTAIAPKPSPYDRHVTIAYLDGTVLRKFIVTGDTLYTEAEICEQLSDDLRYLMPKTPKGKPVLFTAATLEKRTGTGMCLSYRQHRPYLPSYISLYSLISEKVYYSSEYDPAYAHDITDFQQWVEDWCNETSQDDLTDLARFAAQPRQHVRFREGDVFRFPINRRQYGYGRILLDYARMRKAKEPFWDILMGKPLACSVYHIATERDDVSVEELKHLGSLPSVHMMDNHLFYGTYEIIGNIPIGEHEDYPILYGNSVDARDRAVLLQCGKLYRRIRNGTALFSDFTNHSIGFGLNFRLSVLLKCIGENSNTPYWADNSPAAKKDLRNPKFRSELEQVCRQFDVPLSQLLKQ